MGLFCVNFHFRTTDDKALSEALARRGITRYRIVPAKNDWTSLYEEQASEQDDTRIRELASRLSRDLHVAAMAFMVHDSDIAYYWLYDNGELMDEYSSDADYFADFDGPHRPSGGRPEILLHYCRDGVRPLELARILSEKNVRATTFAEHLIEQLAGALGIDSTLAIADYRDDHSEHGPRGTDRPYDDGDGGPGDSPLGPGLFERLAKKFGLATGDTPADPQAKALADAAVTGNTAEIERLLSAGIGIDADAPAPLPAQMTAGLTEMLTAGAAAGIMPRLPQIIMTPLLAAILNKQRQAVAFLVSRGADLKRVHPRFGTAVHAAVGVGDAEILELLIEQGADVNAVNAQRQTPLQLIAANRAAIEHLVQLHATMEAMGLRRPGLAIPSVTEHLPTQGWDACERLLKAHGAR